MKAKLHKANLEIDQKPSTEAAVFGAGRGDVGATPDNHALTSVPVKVEREDENQAQAPGTGESPNEPPKEVPPTIPPSGFQDDVTAGNGFGNRSCSLGRLKDLKANLKQRRSGLESD